MQTTIAILVLSLATIACNVQRAGNSASLKDDGLVTGTIDETWIHGAENCATSTDPPIQVHTYEPDTLILRQSKCLNYEGPFMYLFFGSKKVLMLDTGATGNATVFPLRAKVDELIDAWVAAKGLTSVELVVAHTHGHGDHVAADGQFAGRPNTTVIKTGMANVSAYFGFSGPQGDPKELDLGDRIVDVLPLPGHCADHISVYDRRTGILQTGDSLYPGRLYVSDWDAYRKSIKRLTEFAATKTVSWVLGNHIEMKATAGEDYPIGTKFQPNEHALGLTTAHLSELDAGLDQLGEMPAKQVHDDFIIDP